MTTDTVTTHTDTGLKAARTYYYRVFAVNSSGMGPVSINENYAFDTTASTEAPGTLVLLSAVAKSDTQIDLMWRAPSETGGASITQYCIVVARARAAYAAPTDANCADVGATSTTEVATLNTGSTDAGQLNIAEADNVAGRAVIVVDADDGTKYSHKGLVTSRTLHYWVHAVNSAGFAPIASNPASATTKSTPTLGPAPRNLRGVPEGVGTTDHDGNEDTPEQINVGTVNLYWNVPTGTEPDNDDGYTVQWSLDNRTWLPADALAVVTHGTAFGSTPGMEQAMHSNVAGAVTTEKMLYYRVKVENSKWSTSTRVNLVANRARPDSLALTTAGADKTAAADTLTASVNKYLTRIDLKWAFEEDDFAPVPAVPDDVATTDTDESVPAIPGSPRPTGFLIDYFIVRSR